MLPDLHIVFFLMSFIIKRFKNVFLYYLTISYIIVYSTIIISDILNQVNNSIELGVIKC